ncbi:MAG: glycoside hydrolase [Euryarchaeota archaeon]|nr:glycoside hydrolase [Euryarchaeota archaeon]
MRSAFLVLLLGVLFSGCTGPTDPEQSTVADSPLCPAPCELAADTGPDRAFEPVAARHPTDPLRGVVVSAVFVGDDESGLGDGFKVHVTEDGGRTFDTFWLQDALEPTDPARRYTNYGDPWLVWLEEDRLLLFGGGATGMVAGTPLVAFKSFEIFVVTSTDGGRTWGDGQIIAEEPGVMSLPIQMPYFDQQHVTVGPDGRLLGGWARVYSYPDGASASDVLATQSMDGGTTWEPSVTVEEGDFMNARPAIEPDGTMWMVYRDYSGSEAVKPMHLSRSDDGGATWTQVDLGGLKSISRPNIAADANGVHFTIAEPVEDGFPRVTLVTYRDGGLSRYVLAEMKGEGEPLITVAADPRGGLWATWLEVQENSTNVIYGWHRDANGTERTQRLSDTPIGPNDPVGFIDWPSLGDYMGLGVGQDGAMAAWVSGTRSGQDVRAAFLS